jgi:transcriptional regulator with XRE-family HTH domain
MATSENDYQKLRRILALTISDIAGELRISRSLYGMIETNQRRISSEALLELGKLIAALARIESQLAELQRAEPPRAEETVYNIRSLADLTWLDEKRKSELKLGALTHQKERLLEATQLEIHLSKKAPVLFQRYVDAELAAALTASIENPSDIQRGLLELSKMRHAARRPSISGKAFFELIAARWKIDALREEAKRAEIFVEEA